MRYFLLFLSLWALTLDAESQIWFEGDPFWYYDVDYTSCNIQSVGDLKMWVDRDTVIDQIPMHVLRTYAEGGSMYGPWSESFEEIYYEEGDKVYHYANGNTTLIYDFTFAIGDTMILPILGDDPDDCDSLNYLRLDTIEFIPFGNTARRLQRWRLLNNTDWFGNGVSILEGVGYLGAASHFNFWGQYQYCSFDPCNPNNFSCYYQGAENWSYPPQQDCSFLLSDEKIHLPRASVSILPNPTTGSFRIKSDLPIQQISVYSNMGQLLFTGPEPALNLTGKPVGVYWISLLFENGQRSTQKVILQE